MALRWAVLNLEFPQTYGFYIADWLPKYMSLRFAENKVLTVGL